MAHDALFPERGHPWPQPVKGLKPSATALRGSAVDDAAALGVAVGHADRRWREGRDDRERTCALAGRVGDGHGHASLHLTVRCTKRLNLFA